MCCEKIVSFLVEISSQPFGEQSVERVAHVSKYNIVKSLCIHIHPTTSASSAHCYIQGRVSIHEIYVAPPSVGAEIGWKPKNSYSLGLLSFAPTDSSASRTTRTSFRI
jgi:hypothetical protein